MNPGAFTVILRTKEDVGFEPTRRERPDGFQDRSLKPDLGNLP